MTEPMHDAAPLALGKRSAGFARLANPRPGLLPARASWLTYVIALVALIGVGIAAYLTYIHYAGLKPLCVASGGCERVQSSRYAELAGVPVAVLGLIGYVAILCSLAIPGESGLLAAALFALVGFGFSAYLTYTELFEIHAICQWCVASALLMTALAVLTTLRLLRADGPLGSAAADRG